MPTAILRRFTLVAAMSLACLLSCTAPAARESKQATTTEAKQQEIKQQEIKQQETKLQETKLQETKLGAAIDYFLQFKKDETRAQIEKKLGATARQCSFDDKKMILTCPVAGLGPVKKASFRLFGHKLHSVRLRFAVLASWKNFANYEKQMRELVRGTGPLTEGELTLYRLEDAKERLQRPLKYLPGLAVHFQGEGLGTRGTLSGKVFSFKQDGKQAYGFELLWLPRAG
jgi:hypothetical protein